MAGIEEVARQAGVSASTVSYALSGKRTISPATKAKIQKAIVDLDYRPHAGARALASQRTRTLALVVPLRSGMDLNVVMYFVAGVLTRARAHDHDVLLLTDQDELGITRVGDGAMVDGLIVMDIESSDPRIAHLARLKQPVVLIGLPDDSQGISCVDFDFAAAARLAVRTLAASTPEGPLGLIASPELVYERGTSFAMRLRDAFIDECTKQGRQAIAVPCDSSPAAGRAAVRTMRAEHADLAGVVVHNELAAPGVYAEVGDGLAVVSIEPEASASVLDAQNTRRTVIAMPARDIGAAAVDILMDRLDGASRAEVRLVSPQLTRA